MNYVETLLMHSSKGHTHIVVFDSKSYEQVKKAIQLMASTRRSLATEFEIVAMCNAIRMTYMDTMNEKENS